MEPLTLFLLLLLLVITTIARFRSASKGKFTSLLDSSLYYWFINVSVAL